VGGQGGLPFRFASGASTDGFLLILDITFWFIVLLGIWKVLSKGFKKTSKQ